MAPGTLIITADGGSKKTLSALTLTLHYPWTATLLSHVFSLFHVPLAFPAHFLFRLPQLTRACSLHSQSFSSPSWPEQTPPASEADPGPAWSGGNACRSLSPSRCRSSSGLRQNLTGRRSSRSASFPLLSLRPSSPSFSEIEKRKMI